MRIIYFLMLIVFCFSVGNSFAQEILPDFTVKNNKGKISVSWQNKYSMEIKGISLQRSYDSSKNFTSITILDNPNDAVNGFMDVKVPYNKMYYRLFIAFDSGIYIFTGSQRPDPDPAFNLAAALRKLRAENEIKPETSKTSDKNINKTSASKGSKSGKIKKTVKGKNPIVQQPEEEQTVPLPKKEIIPYPSKRIYTGRDNNIVISLPDFIQKKYTVKFYDEENKPLFVLNKITEGFFIVEKVNFFHAGWFYFEIHEDDTLLEKNKFYIPKD